VGGRGNKTIHEFPEATLLWGRVRLRCEGKSIKECHRALKKRNGRGRGAGKGTGGNKKITTKMGKKRDMNEESYEGT